LNKKNNFFKQSPKSDPFGKRHAENSRKSNGFLDQYMTKKRASQRSYLDAGKPKNIWTAESLSIRKLVFGYDNENTKNYIVWLLRRDILMMHE
jgi:hypothetical protein